MIAYRRFTGLLESKGVISGLECDRLLQKFKGDEWAVLLYLVDRFDFPMRKWGRLWGEALGVAHVELRKTLFQSQIVRKLPYDFAKKHRIIPLYKLGDVVTVAACGLSDHQALMEAEKILGCRISPVFSLPEEIDYAIEVQYKSTGIFSGGRWYTMDEVLALQDDDETDGDKDRDEDSCVTQEDIKKMLAERNQS